jgi:hypothetical protein
MVGVHTIAGGEPQMNPGVDAISKGSASRCVAFYLETREKTSMVCIGQLQYFREKFLKRVSIAPRHCPTELLSFSRLLCCLLRADRKTHLRNVFDLCKVRAFA